jgi:ParB family chromosome partitioning protein
LGKGLGALIPDNEVPEVVATPAAAEGPLRRVPVNSIRPNPYQPRKAINDESLVTLASSVKELGILQPIIVRPVDGEEGQYELIAGERRWRAAILAELEFMPVLVQVDVDDGLFQ